MFRLRSNRHVKTCFVCKIEKELSEFYRHKKMADGYLGKCRACHRAAISANIERRKQDPMWLVKERERCRIKIAAARASGRYKDSPNSRAARIAWSKRNRHKRNAQLKARRAIPRTVATICQRCGKVPKLLHRHHPDYSKPLEILWLCPACHGLVHRK